MLVQLAMTLSTVHGRSLPKESSRKMDSPPKVYLHTFPPLPHVYSMSPFSLKVESWLRLHGIDYECVYCMECGRQLLTLCNLQPDANPQSLTLILSLQYGHRFGPKNQIPFVLVGDEVQLVLCTLCSASVRAVAQVAQ